MSDDKEEVKVERLSLAERSYRNMVHFFSDELKQIHRGDKASNYLSDGQRRKLTDLGILNRNYGYGGCRLLLSEKTKKLLDLGN